MHSSFCASTFPLSWLSPACGVVLAAAVGAPAHAIGSGPPPLLVSTSSVVSATATAPEMDDAAVIRVAGMGGGPRQYLSEGHWLATLGSVPGDVDALARRPGELPGTFRSLAFSLQSNEAGVLDGDVLGFAEGGGLEVLLSEDVLATALGISGTGIDIDALAYDDLDRLLFSLWSDHSGTLLGDVLDGDVLRLELDGTVTRLLPESVIDQCFEFATGVSASTGDVKSLEWVDGEVWFSAQSPSAYDGAVISCGPVPVVIADEAALGLDGAELDAMVVRDDGVDGASLWMSSASAAPGEFLDVAFTGGEPLHPVLVLPSQATGFELAPWNGWGAWYLDFSDPALNSYLAGMSSGILFTDGGGEIRVSFKLPEAAPTGVGFGGETGWSFQTIDLLTLEMQVPFRVAVQ